jgi:hypothetical protein
MPDNEDPRHLSAAVDPEHREELRRLAGSRLRSGRGMMAKAAAIKMLDRFERERSRGCAPPMPSPDWYPREFAESYEYDWQRRPQLRQGPWEVWWSRRRWGR